MAESEGKSRVRKRKDASKSKDVNDGVKSSVVDDDSPDPGTSAKGKVEKNVGVLPCQEMEGGSYWLTRIVFTRAIGFIYCKYVWYY